MATSARTALWCFILATVSVALFAAEQPSAPVPPALPTPQAQSDDAPSPRLNSGKLGNGLRYAIVPNLVPPKHVSLRLLVETGSLQESDAQRGYAHFVEHMAFNGTEHFAAGELVTFLQNAGVAFGVHVNAGTGTTRTVYKLDLPDNGPELVDKGVRILRDFADGILLQPAEVERERGVILNEKLTRQTLDDSTNAFIDLAYAGTLIPEHFPVIGTDESIKQATSTTLRDFYNSWYRPERMVVVVTGEIDPKQIQSLVETHFSTFSARKPALASPHLGNLTDSTAPTASHFGKPNSSTTVTISVIAPQNPTDKSKETRQKQANLNAALTLLDRRLKHVQQNPANALSNAEVRRSSALHPSFLEITISLTSEKLDWKIPLQIAEQEIRKAIEFGFDPTELNEVKEAMTRTAEAAAKNATSIPTSTLANLISDTLHTGGVYVGADEILPRQLAIIAKLNVTDCRQALEDFWTRTQPKIFVTSRNFDGHVDDEIIATYKASQETPVSAPDVLKPVEFAYKDFGAPGEIVQREHVADLDLWQVRFANGVRLNLKKTDFSPNSVSFSLHLGTGRADEPTNMPGLALFAPALTESGVGRHTHEEMQRTISGRGITLFFTAADNAFVFTGNARSSELPFALHYTTAYIVDPAFRKEGERRTKNTLKRIYGAGLTTPTGAFNSFILPFLAGGDPRLGLPDYKRVFSYTLNNLNQWLVPTLANGSLEIAIVGDIDIDATIAEVAKTLGTLPTRAPKPDLSQRTKLNLPQPPEEKYFNFTAEKRPSLLAFVWPVRDSLSAADRSRLNLLASLIQERLRVEIREQLGETYSPRASFSYNRTYPGFAHLICQIQIQPDHADTVKTAMRKLAAALVTDGTTDEEITRLKAQALTGNHDRARSNARLADLLSATQEQPDRLAELRIPDDDSAKITKAELNASAALYLSADNTFIFLAEPKPPKK